MKNRFLRLGTVCLLGLSGSVSLWAQEGPALFKTYCAVCHESGDQSRAPSRAVLKQMTPEQILTALEKGAMKTQGSERSRAEKRTLAEFLTEKKFSTELANPIPKSAFCDSSSGAFQPSLAGQVWNGWGVNTQNTRFQPASAAGLSAEDVPRLKLKWAFGFPGDTSASSQPVVVGGRLYVGSWAGDMYSLDAKTGCIHWTLETEAGVRSAVSIAKAPTGNGLVAYFGDLAANVYAVDAATGKLIWKVKVDDYPLARVTGSPTFYDGRLYVPVSAREESQVADAKYECCRFRGSVVALDAANGKRLWKTYMIATEPRPTQKTKVGTQLWGPAGVSVWNAPTIDAKRKTIYFGTGNSTSFPAANTEDAIVALDMETGKMKWVHQFTEGDVWNGGCRSGDPLVCSDDAPDFDFAASPILLEIKGGRQELVASQKSGMVFALDPDHEGKLIWRQRAGRGGTSGGVMWGPAADENNIYVAVSDVVRTDPTITGRLIAIQLSTSRIVWNTPNPPCGERKPCSPSQAAAVTAIPGVLFSGSNDGFLRAYSAQGGKIIWEYDTVRDFQTVNGVPAKGGSINNGGPAVVGGMVFSNAGYSHHSGVMPGNVLLAFSPE